MKKNTVDDILNDMWKHAAGFVGGFGVALAMVMLAQRLSAYENKDLAALVFKAAIVLSMVPVLTAVWDVAHWWRNRKDVVPPGQLPKSCT